MNKFLFLLLLIVSFFSLEAHEGELISISNVRFIAPCSHVQLHFQMENVNEILLKDVRIEFRAGNEVLASKDYRHFPMSKFTSEVIMVEAERLQNINPTDLEIKVARIFDVPMDWGGWHGIEPSNATYNDIGDHEIFADAPWRMDIYDTDNNRLPIPINVVAHDGNQLVVPNGKPFLEFVDFYIKKSSDEEFGEALNFNDMSDDDFNALFKAKSPDNTDVGVQSFDLSLTEADEEHSLAFNELHNATHDYNYTNLKNSWWFFTLMLPGTELSEFADDEHLDIRAVFHLRDIVGDPYERDTYLRVFRSPEAIPSISGFLRGDTHVHTYFSQSIIEFGSPISATKEAARAIGIDWFIVTDHTTDFDNWPGTNIGDAWQRLGTEIGALNAEDPSIPLIKGQEVSLLNGQDQLIHFLAYPGYETPTNLPYLGDGGGDGTLTYVHATNVLNRLEEIDGFAYSAHPFATEDELPAVGGLWNVGDNEFPANGQPFESDGTVNCNAPGAQSDLFSQQADEIVFNPLKGAQIWGVRSSLSGTADPFDPYNIKNAEDGQRFEAAPDGESNYLVRYRQGEEVVNFVNTKALQLKNADPSLKNFKYYFSAGTDAHGSFNYSNTEGFGTVFTEETETSVDNNAFGNISCVTYCPNGAGAEGEHALKAMHDGNFTLSDGPLVVIGASLDGDNSSNELMMGGDVMIENGEESDVYLNYEYVSTSEFGIFDFLKIFVGTEEGESSFEISGTPLGEASNMSLADVLFNAGVELALDKYFYIRAELQTEAIYGENSPRILEGENFHSFTNPVWIKVNSVVTGVHDEMEASFRIYPNPVDQFLQIESTIELDRIDIYDVEGKLIKQVNLNSNTVDVSELFSGTYLLVASVGEQQIKRRFLVQ